MIELYNIVRQKCKRLYSNLYQIKPPKSLRQKRWDKLGTAWKWLAGNPDAEDLRIINTTMNALIYENNQQYQVNEQINKRIQLLTNTINEVITSTATVNRIALNELEIMTSIMHIDTINTILEDIQDAIVRTKVALPSNKILSLKEIITIRNILVDQGINITLPDETLKFITPKVAVNEETLLYILEVPKLENHTSIITRIIPLIVNNNIIEDYPQYLIMNKQRVFTTTEHTNYVQKHSEIKEFKDNCIKPLIFGRQGKCNVTSETDSAIQLISENRILINNGREVQLVTNCGPDNRNITGNFLITISNCSVTINNETFQSYELEIVDEIIQGALHNIQMIRQLKKNQNITAINQETIMNRKQLQQVFLKQYKHQNWIWALSGGLSLSTICAIMLVLYACARKFCKLKIIQSSRTVNITDNNLTPKSYNELLKQVGISSKVEDDHFSPPGGVTFPHNKSSVSIPTQNV